MIQRSSIHVKVACLPLSVAWRGASYLGCTRVARQLWSALCCRSSWLYVTRSWRESGSSSFLQPSGCTSMALMVNTQACTNFWRKFSQLGSQVCHTNHSWCSLSPLHCPTLYLSPCQLSWWQQSGTLTRGKHRSNSRPRTRVRSETGWPS